MSQSRSRNVLPDVAQAKDLLEQAQGNWSEAEFEAMSIKVLRMFATYNGAATMREPHLSQVKQRPLTQADLTLARKVLARQGAKTTAHISPETFLNNHGGSQMTFPEKIELTPLSGDVKVRVNSPIPTPFGTEDKYNNSVQVAAFVSQLVVNKQGTWQSAVNDSWMKTFHETFLDLTSLGTVVTSAVKILNQDYVWRSLTDIDRNAIQGNQHLTFVRQAMERLNEPTYDVLNTQIVCQGFQTFRKKGKKWFRILGEDGAPLVPISMYQVHSCSEETRELLMDRFPGCFRYLGGSLPIPDMPENTKTLDSASKSSQRMREVLGGNDSPSLLLAGMKDFSGLTDLFGKRIAFYLSSVLSCWSLGEKVDIQLVSVGDIGMLSTSLNHWKLQARAHLPSTLVKDVDPSMPLPSSSLSSTSVINDLFFTGELDYRFIAPGAQSSIPKSYRDFIIEIPRPDSVVVYWSEKSLPTSEKRGERVKYDDESVDLLPVRCRKNKYIISTVIFGGAPFFQQNDVKRYLAKEKIVVDWSHDCHVYKFSTASCFRGIISSIANLFLVGYGYRKLDGLKYDLRPGVRLVKVELQPVVSQSAWYDEVAKDSARAIVSFMAPISRYSPISNLCRMSKAAIVTSRMRVEKEDGELFTMNPVMQKRNLRVEEVAPWVAGKEGEEDVQPDDMTLDENENFLGDEEEFQETEIPEKKEKEKEKKKIMDPEV